MVMQRGRLRHKCSRCLYSNDGYTNFKKHLKMHGRNAAFACELCDYSSNDSGVTKRHRKTSHPAAVGTTSAFKRDKKSLKKG